MPKLTTNQIIIASIGGIFILSIVLIFLGVIPGLKTKPSGPQTKPTISVLNVVGVESQDSFRKLADGYITIRPGVEINYTQISEENYEKTLLNLLAAGEGPDVLMIHNSWLPKHSNKLLPLSIQQFSLSQFQKYFVDVTEKDFTANDLVYVAPLYVDTLALFYNKDIFNSKGIAVPPSTWEGLEEIVPQLEIKENSGRIIRSAVALGGSDKTNSNFFDIISLLMAQFGGLNKEGDKISFSFGRQGENAINYYLQYSNSANKLFTWQDEGKESIDSFSGEGTAMIFGYGPQISTIISKNPFINIGVAPMPQFNQNSPKNFASYWGLAVSKQSKNLSRAIDFVISSSIDERILEPYLTFSLHSPALRTLIEKNKTNNGMAGIFSRQALTADSWRVSDQIETKQIFSDMIQSILEDRLYPEEAYRKAETEVNRLRNF